MFILKKLFCRTFQTAFRLALPLLPYREPKAVRSCADIESILIEENSTSVLVITDGGIVKNGLLSPVTEVLSLSGVRYTVYDKTCQNPTVSNVEEALKLYHENECDTLIAIGGGSPMDCAKAVGARVAYPKKSLNRLKGILRVIRRIPTLIAIPTTAGTGSETTLAAIITDEKEHHKYALMSFPLIPHYAVLDPKLTFSLPRHLTATTGMDALTHAVEAYIGRSTTRETRKLALDAVKLIFENIETAYENGTDKEARAAMLTAAYKAGIAFSKSYVGYVHAVAHSLGGRYGTPHGLANAVILPYVLEEYGAAVYKKLHRLAIAAGISNASESEKEGAEKFISAVRFFNERMNIPATLDGIKEEDIPEMARYAEKEANPLYPVPVLMTAQQLKIFYRKAGGIYEKN